ncbi:pyridoxamine 5'-phosphate oxidase [Roseicyclus sp.]|uniref:pyridoxamine 5'-phosphate oxidase n=1 Tax=Roseicyclus sp. TaxID=1914329 RepID=UPI003F6D734D
MSERTGIFAGHDPFLIAQEWLSAAEGTEPNDPNAIALATVDADGLPNVRMVLLKQIEQQGAGQGAFVFYTNYGSVKGAEIVAAGKAAFVLHSKTQRRQMRVRGLVAREDGPAADEYFASRSLKSRLGAWASKQSQPLDSRASLLADVARITAQYGTNPPRPPFWGGFRIAPLEIEFWADGAFRLHDRFRWSRPTPSAEWQIQRLNP